MYILFRNLAFEMASYMKMALHIACIQLLLRHHLQFPSMLHKQELEPQGRQLQKSRSGSIFGIYTPTVSLENELESSYTGKIIILKKTLKFKLYMYSAYTPHLLHKAKLYVAYFFIHLITYNMNYCHCKHFSSV